MQLVRRFGSSVKQAPPSGLLTTPTSFGKCRVSISAFRNDSAGLLIAMRWSGIAAPGRTRSLSFVENHKFDSKQLGR